MTSPAITRLILYTKRIDEMVRFYETHFGYTAHRIEGDRIIELKPCSGGVHLLLHPAGKAAREGQAVVKLVFDVPDVPAFCAQALKQGLVFGAIHKADGYQFANAKDPSRNSISVSSRAFVHRD
ncbi:VOC family protein [Rhodobacteraceae bacterium B1Z28]|uniref:VOC family protein n=1 Tax=Ruegeria haliotis TaxID=2747601 RepID=A0ABX2PSV4_9RHOB|nr:VOC family protein [Ruegeria haliotis]NVO57268.1 VOC family protein [Ruegeria haliotis]